MLNTPIIPQVKDLQVERRVAMKESQMVRKYIKCSQKHGFVG